ncbi:MAG: hypothetical protein QGG90_05480, partial [Nitrospinota bacterium]|nr:hypothetical protein [Nitrospinota bacterium]
MSAPEPYNLRPRETVSMRTRDGVRLDADLYRPAARGTRRCTRPCSPPPAPCPSVPPLRPTERQTVGDGTIVTRGGEIG